MQFCSCPPFSLLFPRFMNLQVYPLSTHTTLYFMHPSLYPNYYIPTTVSTQSSSCPSPLTTPLFTSSSFYEPVFILSTHTIVLYPLFSPHSTQVLHTHNFIYTPMYPSFISPPLYLSTFHSVHKPLSFPYLPIHFPTLPSIHPSCYSTVTYPQICPPHLFSYPTFCIPL